MSIALPLLPTNNDFIADLLQEQRSLSAVERFSKVHESAKHTQARYYRDLLPSSPLRAGFQLAFEVDLDKCTGCKACVVACHAMNGLEDDEVWRRVGTTTAPGPLGRIQHVTTACHHCEEPGCLLGCPVKAYDKNPVTGIVRHLDDQCIGCKYCTMMCPYDVPQYSKRLGIVRKCDMCHQRLSAGEAPACVQGCPNEAIAIREVAVGSTQRIIDVPTLAPSAPESSITKPTTKYKTVHRAEFQLSTPLDADIDRVSESHWPLAVMLVATQASVGLIFVERLFVIGQQMFGAGRNGLLTPGAILLALGLSLFGLSAAPLHLGQPLRAWRVFLGLRTSWLSREAMILGKFVGLLSLANVLFWYPALQNQFRGQLPVIKESTLAWFASVTLGLALFIGFLGLVSSAMVYVATKRELWRMSRTMPRFLISAAVTGCACFLPVMLNQTPSLMNGLVVSSILVVLVMTKLGMDAMVCFLNYQANLDRRSIDLAQGPMLMLVAIRFALGILAILSIALSIASLLNSGPSPAIWLAVVAALCLLLGEIAERILYFTTVVCHRMPGTLR